MSANVVLLGRPLAIGSLTLLTLAFPFTSFAQRDAGHKESFRQAFERRASATQGQQPKWSVPLLAPHAGLIQSFRADFTRKANTSGTYTWDYGAGKGFNFIPLPKTQIDINVPSFVDKSENGTDGFGDMQLGVKYRLLTANEQHGNYSMMVGVAASFPTSEKNGQTHHVITPNVAVGKGIGRWDVQSSASINLPVGNTAAIGRNVTWNTLVQCRLGQHLWPEIESNTTFYRDGTNSGKTASYVLPGIMTKFSLRPDVRGSRLTLASGFGVQFAVTPFHPYDHMPIASVRLGF